jgi:L-erythro-3,5-diaminohexanoate dehydrogenase
LTKVLSVNLKRGEVDVEGYGIVFSSGNVARLPEGIQESIALQVLDVCGAPAWVRRKVRPEDKVLIVGMGKAGVLSAFAARETLVGHTLWLADFEAKAIENLLHLNLGANIVLADARAGLSFAKKLRNASAPLFDWVIDTCNTPETELADILSVKPGGGIIFFNMATRFSRAVLLAEGIGKDIEMIMGTGFIEGHWQYALDRVRKNEELVEWFTRRGG